MLAVIVVWWLVFWYYTVIQLLVMFALPHCWKELLIWRYRILLTVALTQFTYVIFFCTAINIIVSNHDHHCCFYCNHFTTASKKNLLDEDRFVDSLTLKRSGVQNHCYIVSWVCVDTHAQTHTEREKNLMCRGGSGVKIAIIIIQVLPLSHNSNNQTDGWTNPLEEKRRKQQLIQEEKKMRKWKKSGGKTQEIL